MPFCDRDMEQAVIQAEHQVRRMMQAQIDSLRIILRLERKQFVSLNDRWKLSRLADQFPELRIADDFPKDYKYLREG